jgi:hypothetical protein
MSRWSIPFRHAERAHLYFGNSADRSMARSRGRIRPSRTGQGRDLRLWRRIPRELASDRIHRWITHRNCLRSPATAPPVPGLDESLRTLESPILAVLFEPPVWKIIPISRDQFRLGRSRERFSLETGNEWAHTAFPSDPVAGFMPIPFFRERNPLRSRTFEKEPRHFGT